MPLLRHSVVLPFRRDRQTVELARQAHREIADVDHLLDLAEALRHDLADLQRHEAAERLLAGPQFLAEQPHEFATPRRRHLTPGQEGRLGTADGLGDIRARVSVTFAITSPVMGERTTRSPAVKASSATPSPMRISRASAAMTR